MGETVHLGSWVNCPKCWERIALRPEERMACAKCGLVLNPAPQPAISAESVSEEAEG
jgi:hypothetical protein